MLSGIFRRRRAAVAVAALMTGSALGVGVPSLILHNPPSRAAAATASITLGTSQFGQLTFAKLDGIANDDPAQQNCTSSGCTYTPTAVPPVITLREPFATGITAYKGMMTWEAAERSGAPTGRMDATLTLTTSTGTTLATYILENAWPANVDLLAGNPQTAYFTVKLQGDALLIQS